MSRSMMPPIEPSAVSAIGHCIAYAKFASNVSNSRS